MNENDYVSGNDFSINNDNMDFFESVSGNDFLETEFESAQSTETNSDVSGNAVYTEIMVTQDNTEILTALENIQYGINALVFITLFVWIEQKLLTAVRRLFKKWMH